MRVLRRLRVSEKHGIRRFLYPLSVRIPSAYRRSFQYLGVTDEADNLLPSQVADTYMGVRLDFAVSLAPHETHDFFLVHDKAIPAAPILDPLNFEFDEKRGLSTHQERVSFVINEKGQLSSVLYDGLEHLAHPLQILLADAAFKTIAKTDYAVVPFMHPLGNLSLAVERVGLYENFLPDRVSGTTKFELTACKSWLKSNHTLYNKSADSVLKFVLPLQAASSHVTADFGVGNGIYANLGQGKTIWTADFGTKPYVKWKISCWKNEAEQVNFVGEVQTKKEWTAQSWFHWLDGEKSLAVAIDAMPRECERMEVTLSHDGIVEIAFYVSQPLPQAEFGVCWHFLNDVPAIAAATNPQSILLPPTVEVL